MQKQIIRARDDDRQSKQNIPKTYTCRCLLSNVRGVPNLRLSSREPFSNISTPSTKPIDWSLITKSSDHRSVVTLPRPRRGTTQIITWTVAERPNRADKKTQSPQTLARATNTKPSRFCYCHLCGK